MQPSLRKTVFRAAAIALVMTAPLAAQPVPSGLHGPITLEQSLAAALESSYAIRQALERIEEQTGTVVEVRAARLPQASVSAEFQQLDPGRLERFGDVRFGSDQHWAVGIQARYRLYDGGGARAGVAAQESVRDAALYGLQATVETVLLEVREQFLAVLLAEAGVAVRQEAITLLEQELATARSRFDAGAGSQFEVLRAEVALANGQVPLIRARNALRLAKEDLRRMIGLEEISADDLAPRGELGFEPVSYDLDQALRSARENRAELRQLDLLVRASESTVAAQQAGRRPEVAVTAGYGVEKSRFSPSLGDTVEGWVIGLQGSWAIFDGHATRGRVMRARSGLNLAELQLAETRLRVEVEVRRAHSFFIEATELAAVSERVVQQADESLRLARARFDAGAATQLDVLQAQVALTEARNNQVQARHDFQVAVARLRRAMGGADPVVHSGF